MEAVLAQDTKSLLGISKDNQVLAQQPGAHRPAVGFGHLLGHADGEPVPAHDAAHGSIALDAAQKLILFASKHT
jgi:hypothetical protein